MPSCADIEDYYGKVENSNGLNKSDFSVLKCIPNELFELFNVAGSS